MKKHLLYALGAVLAVSQLASSCGNKEKGEEIKADEAKIAEMTANYQQATNFNDSLMLLMSDIYTGLDSINTQEQLLYAPGQGDNANRRAEISANLSAIKSRLAANRQLLTQLDNRLKNSNNKNEVLRRTIAQLKQRLEAQDRRVQELETQLADAHAQIGQLNNQIAETQQQVRNETAAREEAQQQATEATNQLNTVYYAIGTNKELKANGLISKKFLGATKVLEGDFNTAYFTKADKRTLSVIHTTGKKVKILTRVPAGSYQIVKEANGTCSIKILDPAKFWMNPYLLIQID